MIWGDPRCHANESQFARPEVLIWRPPDPMGARLRHPDDYPAIPDGVLGGPYGYPFRTCGYCGSIHPEDLYALLGTEGVSLEGSDWKHGWPHKFYVWGVPNPIAGRLCVSRSTSRWDEAQGRMVTFWHPPEPAPPFTHAKFYNVHLLDLDDETFALLAPKLAEHSHIEFSREDGKVTYCAPRYGYQRSGASRTG